MLGSVTLDVNANWRIENATITNLILTVQCRFVWTAVEKQVSQFMNLYGGLTIPMDLSYQYFYLRSSDIGSWILSPEKLCLRFFSWQSFELFLYIFF